MSPLALLYVKVGSFNFLSLSGYDILGIPGIILVALFWTLSNFSISDFLCGDHTELLYSKCDDDDSFCLTSLLISVMMSDSSHCQNRTIYKLAYIYGAVGSIVLLHA